ncbi:unnamed protein product [Clavelina lepadiformis]|uniref:Protein kinase domain-containing protein n=1 Tax=Clavelina lepadiformis TaxID=159417 RepID=A0ABP0FQM6_CLALP
MSLYIINIIIKLFKCDEIFCLTDDDEGDLGEGSYGKVRLGYHKRLGEIAIKCSEMKGGKQEKKLLEKRIKKEIGHLQQANHENIVRVYGWTHWPGAVAIIMEFLPAGNLKAILMDEDIVLGPLLRARFGAEIANGLAFIHNLFDDKRLLHGDIKPENILLTEDLHCKIGDFGAAQLSNYTGCTTSTGYKDSNSIQLTKLYSAPERLRNISIKVSPKHDTYSYGMTLHMILAREMLLDTGTPVQTFTERIIEGQRPSEESIQEYINKLEVEGLVSFADIIRFLKEQMTRCWQQDPADRPTMIDVKESLYSNLADYDFQLIRKQVNEALEGITICKKAVFKEGCVTVNHFRPPDFSQNDSLSPMHSTIENDATLKRSSSLTANTDTSIDSLDKTCTPANPSPAEKDEKSAEGFPDNNEVPPELHGDSYQSEEIKENSAPENASSDKKSSNDRECMSRSSEFPEDKLELNARQTSQRKDSPALSSKNDSITNVKDCFEYLRGCGLLENKWNNEVIETVGTKLGNLCRFVIPNISKLLRNKVADEVLRCNAPPLFHQYFKLLIEDGNVYPTDSSKCALLKYLKQTIRSLSQFSPAFCVQCGKEGLITLMAVHLRHVQSCSGLETEEKELVEQTCIEILFNSAKTPECLMHVKVLNIFEIMSPFRKEMDKETDLKRKPILTFSAFLLSLVTEKEQIPLLKVHRSLIGYIISVISKCIVNEEKYIQLEKSFISVLEMCEGLARLTRCTENARTILDVSESMKFITSLLKSEKGSYREVSLQIVDNISGSEENKGKISEQVELIKILKTISIKDPVENMRTMAKELCDILMCIEKDIGLNEEDKLPGDDRRNTRAKSYHDIVTIDEAKADVGSCLEYLQSCDWLETEWNKNMTDAAEKRLKKLLTYTDPSFSELFRKEIAYEVLREDAMSLFMRYFRTKVQDGNLYPRDSITCQFLEDFKQIVWNLADASAAFCVESCKKGLVPLIAVHFRHVQSVSWLSSEKKVKVSRTCLGILYNCARRPESLTHEKMLNIVNIPSQFRNEMAIEPRKEIMESLTFFAFLLSYLALEHQMHLLSVHQSLIKYIFDIIDEGLKNDERFEFESGAVSTLSEICDGLGQLARNKDNAANIVNLPGSMKRITSVLKSGNQKTKKSGLQLLYNLCLLNENTEEIRKQTGLIDLLRKILMKESVA